MDDARLRANISRAKENEDMGGCLAVEAIVFALIAGFSLQSWVWGIGAFFAFGLLSISKGTAKIFGFVTGVAWAIVGYLMMQYFGASVWAGIAVGGLFATINFAVHSGAAQSMADDAKLQEHEQQAAQPGEANDAIVFCRKCGAKSDANSRFCSACGADQ